jgi:hypothetical protein
MEYQKIDRILKSKSDLLTNLESKFNNCEINKIEINRDLESINEKLSVYRDKYIRLSTFVIPWDEAKNNIGNEKIVCGKVANVNSWDSPIFLDIGFPYPNPNRFSVVVWPSGYLIQPDPVVVREKYERYIGEIVCANGLIKSYKGIPQIELDFFDDIVIQKY